MSAAHDVILVAFEGPDRYSFVGGLATRMNDLAEALAARGSRVRHIFVGDPNAPHVEERGGVLLERWAQWISAHHPRDCYDGEDGKRRDMAVSLPPHLADLVADARRRGRRAVVMFEDWQTADIAVQTHLRLEVRGLRQAASLFWTANNTYGFGNVDFPTLGQVAVIATVSRFMRAELAREGVDPEVLPNGLATRYLRPLGAEGPAVLRDAFGDRPTFVKVARFDPDKRWLWAIDAVAHLRDRGLRPRLLMRGSRTAYADAVGERIAARGLGVHRLALPAEAPARDVAAAVRSNAAEVLFLDFFIAEDVLRGLYAAADGVLANSEKEPFGLVGLEVMASSGIPYVGRTGEDYAIPYGNAIVVQSDDPRELEAHMATLRGDPALARRMRAEGRATAARFAWPNILPAYEAAWEAAARLGR
ncbi:MAG TPA: glycosyltransferase family 4 protein [Candidatus Limnocylindria bacterium]|nr:glycosyltransferase family 4 protein [Candidatus Limnocylindria bacterium]